ncbi:hypothetical protein A3K86_14520 [Photobacterium jeanii]|uniref:DNA-binding transcriptional repressor CapW winged helix-turn-helix domain-containing protein n=1 Tax=Photobacterium jeanii TaxID=858640 RepID=A0A178KAR5_9GAMM|nr:hypothetical protein [Photobacterium jeanii]OAN13772.1 hypothetical protein A3K86_14520 [Photobacterium jeanii]PST88893.1 hypothetical protein C9I91_16385 [Photobacterium jeanii]
MAIYHDKFIEAKVVQQGKVSSGDIMGAFPLDLKRANEILKFYSVKNTGSIEYSDIEHLYKQTDSFRPLYHNCDPDEVIKAIGLLFK